MRPARLRALAAATVVLSVLLHLTGGVVSQSGGSVAHAAGDVALVRLEGADRIATAVAVARKGFPGGASTAVIARADAFPDAMTAAALAGALGGPVLLSHRSDAPTALTTALRDLGVKRAVMVGGASALAPSVGQALRAHVPTVTRVQGDDRFATAAALADEVAKASGIGTVSGKRTVFLANGDAFPDALAAGAIAFHGKYPILLTRSGSLPASTDEALRRLGVNHVIVLGGGKAVSKAVTDRVRALGATVQRVGGSTRTETAAMVADLAVKSFGLNATSPFLVRGDAFADALVAGPAAGKLGTPMLLTASPRQPSIQTLQWFADHCEDVATVIAVGGTGAVTPGAAGAARTSAAECRVTGSHGVSGIAVDASTTGPTAYFDPALGRRLTYADLKPSGTVTTTKHGQVIQKLDVHGQIRIAHNDVTIRAVRIRNTDGASSTYSISYAHGSNAKGAKISYVEIDGTQAPLSVGVVLNNYTFRHSHIKGHRSGLHFGGNSVIAYSYIHSQVLTPGSHNVAIATHGANGAVIRGNNLVGSTSAALSLYPDFGVVRDILVEENLFNGGSYCTYAGSTLSKPFGSQTEHIRYVNNAFGQDLWDRCGIHGAAADFHSHRPGNQWQGNIWERSGAAVNAPG